MSEIDWLGAENYLTMLIGLYEGIGPAGVLGLTLTLYPLRRRFDAGERTRELYDAIMACE